MTSIFKRYAALSLALQAASIACALLAAAPARAEQADRYKKIDISAEHSYADEKKKTSIWTGEFLLTRGTLTIRADKGVVNEAPDGLSAFILTGGPSGQVFFRQKRDGGPDLWAEGVADRVEYDERSDLVKFISKAHVKYLEGKKVTQEQEGEFLSYDSKNEVFMGTNSTSGVRVPGGGRVKLTIAPKAEEPRK